MTAANNPTPEVEPVAWRWRHRSSINWHYGSLEEAKSWMAIGGYSHVDLAPLYDATTIARMTAEMDALKIESSKHAYEWGMAQRQRDDAEKRVRELEAANVKVVVQREEANAYGDAEHVRAEAALTANKLLSERIAVLEGGLQRLASPEAFTVSRMSKPEEQARMHYADDVLRRARDAREGK